MACGNAMGQGMAQEPSCAEVGLAPEAASEGAPQGRGGQKIEQHDAPASIEEGSRIRADGVL
jgi:hypothetical protein